jgi:hypothetical protein
MIERGCSKRFPLEPFAGGRIILQFLRQKLQRDMSVQLEVFGFVNHAHPAATELFQDAVVRNGLADHGRFIYGKARGASALQTSSAQC